MESAIQELIAKAFLDDSGYPTQKAFDQRGQHVENQTNIVGDVEITVQLPLQPPIFEKVPRLPHHFVGRTHLLNELVDRLIAKETTTLSAEGLPGVGKTTLAIALARHPRVLEHFVDGVLWTAFGRTPDVASIHAKWADLLGAEIFDITDPAARMARIDAAIGQRRLLFVLDDVWLIEAIAHLRPSGPHVVQILTTRDSATARQFAGVQNAISVPVLDKSPSHELVYELAPEAWASDPIVAASLAEQVGGLPLALELLGGELAKPERSLFPELSAAAFAQLADPRYRLQLTAERLGSTSGKKYTLKEVILWSLAALGEIVPAASDTFFALGAFAPKPATFELDAAKVVTGADAATLALLVSRSLLEKTGDGGLMLHQTLADVAATKTSEFAYRRQCNFYANLISIQATSWATIDKAQPQILLAHTHCPKTIVNALRDALVNAGHPLAERRKIAFLLIRLGWHGCGAQAEELLKYLELTARYVEQKQHLLPFQNCLTHAIEDLPLQPMDRVQLLIYRAATFARVGNLDGAQRDYARAETLLGSPVCAQSNHPAYDRLCARTQFGLANILVVRFEDEEVGTESLIEANQRYEKAFAFAQEHGSDPVLLVNIETERAMSLHLSGEWDKALAIINAAEAHIAKIPDMYERTIHAAYRLETKARIYYEGAIATTPCVSEYLNIGLSLCYEQLELLGNDPLYRSYIASAHVNAAECLMALNKLGSSSSAAGFSAEEHLLEVLKIAEDLKDDYFAETARKHLAAIGSP